MSVIDKMIAAVTPPKSEKDRAEARTKALTAAQPGDWLSLILDHHVEIEEALAAVEDADDIDERDRLQGVRRPVDRPRHRRGGRHLSGFGGKRPDRACRSGLFGTGHGKDADGVLEKLDPMSSEFEEKLKHVKGALQNHMYEEESGWFLDLKKTASAEDQETMTVRYAEEFDRYIGDVVLDEDVIDEDEITDEA